MNWIDTTYLVISGVGVWFVGVAILIHAVVTHRHGHSNAQISSELKQTRTEVGNGVTELGRDTSGLREDLSELREEMGKTRNSIDNFYKTLRRMYSWWFPYGGESE